MSQTTRYGLPYESEHDRPGWSVTGGPDGADPILAVETEDRIHRVEALRGAGHRYLTTVAYTTSDTFTKGDYPGLRAVMVRMVGGGGAGGAAFRASSTDLAVGSGGWSGAYAERYIAASALPSVVMVTVGAGGQSSTGAAQTVSGSGGASSFGSFCWAAGGSGGVKRILYGTSAGMVVADNEVFGEGQTGGDGDLVIPSSSGGAGMIMREGVSGQIVGRRGQGAPAPRVRSGPIGQTSAAGAGLGSGVNHPGAGGNGAQSSGTLSTARQGGVGGNGLVLVDVFV